MYANGVLILSLVASFVILAATWIWLCRLGLKWAGDKDARLSRVVLAYLSITAIGLLIGLVLIFVPTNHNSSSLDDFFAVAGILIFVVSSILVIRMMFEVSWLGAFEVWLATQLNVVLGWVLASFVFTPFLFEAFVMSTGPMSPSLNGRHFEHKCSECGATSVGSVPYIAQGTSYQTEGFSQSICTSFHITQSDQKRFKVLAPDRVLVAKFLKPKRWDVVAYKVPIDQSQVYTQRVVGLPGETVYIKDGNIFVNGSKVTPPKELEGIKYLTAEDAFQGGGFASIGSVKSPAVLRQDEYFVLGDFTTRSLDSRGSPASEPYSVPSSNIVGVVSHIYWPTNRWRTFR